MKKINVKPININKKTKHKSNIDWLKIALISILALSHIAIIILVVVSNRYYSLEMKTFLGIVGALLSVLVIIDVIFFVALKYKEMVYKIITLVLAVFMLIIGAGGSYYVSKINKVVNNVIENDDVEQYETISGVFAYYTQSESKKTFSSLDDLKASSNLKVGVITDDGYGTGTIAQNILTENGINASITVYNTAEDLLSGLVGTEEDENVDVAVFPASYRSRWLSDTEVGASYEDYLDNMVDFYSFEEKVKVGDNETANQDLTVEPFNILLIGFAPENEEMTVGLADTIIVATINPQTFTVSMTSVARDTYTELACARGTKQKINAARGYSKQCLMDTVGELLGLDINYYMEVNFKGVVEIVDAIGGIVVDNPVEFVGQSASSTRGEMSVLVPAGENVPLDGEGALAFARERHAYADGDFQRQKNQQMVISRIAEKLLAMSDVNQAIAVMEAAGDNMTTNLSLNQLKNIFNYLIKHKNTTGVTTYNMIDIRSLRLTGYASWYYSYSMRLAQWIYRLYEGSITETKENIADVLGEYTTSDIKQISYLKFFANNPYSRGLLYSTYFNEAEIHEEMPAFYATLTNMTYSEALAWANTNGVTLNVTFIDNSSSDYVASLDGQVVSQYPRSGALVSEYPTGSITVMGNQDPNYDPEYTVEGCNDETSCKAWAESKGITAITETKYDASQSEGAFAGTNYTNGDKMKKSQTLVIYLYTNKTSNVTIPSYDGLTYDQYVSKLKELGFANIVKASTAEGATESNNGSIASVSPSPGTSTEKGTTITITAYAYTAPEPIVDPCANGHTVETWTTVEPSCNTETGESSQGYTYGTCSVCKNEIKKDYTDYQGTCTIITEKKEEGGGDDDSEPPETE